MSLEKVYVSHAPCSLFRLWSISDEKKRRELVRANSGLFKTIRGNIPLPYDQVTRLSLAELIAAIRGIEDKLRHAIIAYGDRGIAREWYDWLEGKLRCPDEPEFIPTALQAVFRDFKISVDKRSKRVEIWVENRIKITIETF